MSVWNDFPGTYRDTEVRAVLEALHRGASVSVLGLSGSGKSNLLGFLAQRCSSEEDPLLLLDCNRLLDPSPLALLDAMRHLLGVTDPLPQSPVAVPQFLEQALAAHLASRTTLALMFDRFDIFAHAEHFPLHNVLRALRDAHKHRLSYLFATRRPLPLQSELAELVQGCTLWLGPLGAADARWNVMRFASRHAASWDDQAIDAILQLSRGYPSLLKAACEAHAAGAAPGALAEHPAVQARVADFWEDEPTDEQLQACGLAEHPLLHRHRGPSVAPNELTAYEQRLYDYLQAHAGRVCKKDELIRAVWPEDAIYEEGVRDSSLAQLVRRLRLKVEADASQPRFIHTVPGRGYIFRGG